MSTVGTDWAVDRIVSVTDGDTVRVVRRRSAIAADGLGVDLYDAGAKGVPIRLVTLDTPERGEPGHDEALRDVDLWIGLHWKGPMEPTSLRIETWPGGGFDRLLGDIYVEGDRSNTLSQWMLRERGWLPYVRGQ